MKSLSIGLARRSLSFTRIHHHISDHDVLSLRFDTSTLSAYSSHLSSFDRRVKIPEFKYRTCPKAGIVREAAVLIPLCTVNQQPAVLFTVRSKALSKHQGEVSFPGGMKDEEEMSLEDTMLREVEEEIHLPKSNVQVLGHLYDVPDRSRTIRVRPFIGFIGHFSDQDIKNMTFNTDEVSEIFTLTMNQITDAKLVSWDVMGNGLRVPIFHGSGKDDHRVWGLTAYILNIALQYIFFPKREYVRSQL